jgi:hypothetical protein
MCSSLTCQTQTVNSYYNTYLCTGGPENALSVQVRYQSTDSAFLSSVQAGLTPTPGVSTTSTSTNSTRTNSTNTSPTATVTVTPSANNLSAGAKAGIGVLTALLCLALLIIGALILLRRRKRSGVTEEGQQHDQSLGIDLKPELEAPAPPSKSASYESRNKIFDCGRASSRQINPTSG